MKAITPNDVVVSCGRIIASFAHFRLPATFTFGKNKMETVSPNIFVNDIHATLEFYQILGFTVVTAVPEPKNPIFVLMTCGSVTFMFQTFASIENTLPVVNRSNGGSLLLYIKMNNIRAFFEKIKDRVTVLQGLEKTFYGATEFSIKDNNNYMLTFAEDE